MRHYVYFPYLTNRTYTEREEFEKEFFTEVKKVVACDDVRFDVHDTIMTFKRVSYRFIHKKDIVFRVYVSWNEKEDFFVDSIQGEKYDSTWKQEEVLNDTYRIKFFDCDRTYGKLYKHNLRGLSEYEFFLYDEELHIKNREIHIPASVKNKIINKWGRDTHTTMKQPKKTFQIHTKEDVDTFVTMLDGFFTRGNCFDYSTEKKGYQVLVYLHRPRKNEYTISTHSFGETDTERIVTLEEWKERIWEDREEINQDLSVKVWTGTHLRYDYQGQKEKKKKK